MTTLIKVFDDEEYLNNVILPLSLKVDLVIFIFHHQKDPVHLQNTKEVIQKYRKCSVQFLRLNDDEKEIEELLRQYPDAAIDISSHRYLMMLLFEKVIHKKNFIIYYDIEENVLKDYRSHKVIEKEIFSLMIEDLLKLSGANLKQEMHKKPDLQNEETTAIIKEAVELSLSNYSAFITYIQKINHIITKPRAVGGGFELEEKDVKKIEGDPMYKRYQKLGMFEIDDNRLRFKNHFIKELFNVSGSWLESYLYIILKESGVFDDVIMSAVLDFSSRNNRRFPIICEVDAIVLKNNHLLFLSCKSNKVDTDALNEIKTHQERFGNALSHPVICTVEDLKQKNPSIYLKAQGLNIAVVEQEDFEQKRLIERLLEVVENQYEYEKISR